ncbi:MAG: leucine-rich repeat domain-containing protein [Acidobacteria bacterium]|nr:leucine-rich repeat domain-containing protein [Acidobacteriota bacterium]
MPMKNTPEHIQQLIEEARRKKFKKLSLSGLLSGSYDNEGDVPPKVFELKNLEELTLSACQIRSLPDAIANLSNLRRLDLSSNSLTSLPEGLTRLRGLRQLHLQNNLLATLPPLVTELAGLEELNLWGNRLAHLPDAVSRLKNLTYLDVGKNQIRTLPPSLAQLSKLSVLWLSNNPLDFSAGWEWVGSLRNLTRLSLAACLLEEVPEWISHLHNLRKLNLVRNQVTSLPDFLYELTQLEVLDLRNNLINEISSKILQLENLKSIDLGENPVRTPPPEVLWKGVGDIKKYFKQLENEGKDYLFEAKLLVVGEGGAGKTTLAKKIQNPKYRLKEEDSTKGIEVIPWSFPLVDGRPFRVNIWDFGGQEIYHATHQFFLTKRSLYILVADTRKEDTDFFYWLNIVELLSDGSPLLIVKNERQDRRREINDRLLRGQFPNLKETLATNLATNRGLDRILVEVMHYLKGLPHVGATLPKTWVKVREALERDERNYIGSQEYFVICERNGFKEQKDKLQLSGYLHDLGVCLHFQDDPLLRKTVILKPRWGTDAVYKVLDNNRVVGSLGKFDRADLADIWRADEYAEMRDELLQLMINFKLCYRIPGSDLYIAPQLLTENQPHYEWDEADNLLLRYIYEFMPKGIITQFIVAMHEMIAGEGQGLVWRSGVIVEDGPTRAEVIEHYGRREIKIRVAGRRKKELMTVISYELDKIHASYNRLRYSKLIPCNCAKCKSSQEPHFYPAEVLRQFMDDAEEHIQCQKSYRMVAVRGLLDDVTGYARGYTWGSEPGEAMGPPREQVFVSYSHADKVWLDRLQTMLAPLKRGGMSVWADTDIGAGDRWRDEIARALASAKVAVLLVSPNFLASEFIAERELPPLLAAAEGDGLRVVWVAVSHCLYKDTAIADYQAANDPARPLASIPAAELDGALVRVCEKIKAAAGL